MEYTLIYEQNSNALNDVLVSLAARNGKEISN